MPRYTYWTIVLPEGPTSFRARDRETLLPTLKQLQSRHPEAAMKWFANGRLWDSPEAAREFGRLARIAWRKTRGPEWRPGGEHRDPRARFNKPRPPRRKPVAPGGGPPDAGSGPGRGPSARPDRPKGARPFRPKGGGPGGSAGRPFGRDPRQRRPYRPTGGNRRGGGGGRGGGGRGRP